MGITVGYDYFRRVFLHNVAMRSRTAAGASETGVSSTKKKLLLEGDALRAQVRANTERLIESVWKAREFDLHRLTPPALRFLSEHWYDIINFGLQRPDVYEDAQYALIATGGAHNGQLVRLNSRYRTWITKYHKANPLPEELEEKMDQFYEQLHRFITGERKFDEVSLLALVDHTLDQVLHPWADSCGRHATAMVMWLSLLFVGWRPPVFSPKEEHHAAMKYLTTHVMYFKACLSRELSVGV